MVASPRASFHEILTHGALKKIPGNEQGQLQGDEIAGMFDIHSGLVAVNAAAGHYVVPYDCRIVSGVMRITTTQTSANGSMEVHKNGVSIGSLTVLTADTAPALKNITVAASGGTITTTDANLTKGDILHIARPNTGAAGVTAVTLLVVPR